MIGLIFRSAPRQLDMLQKRGGCLSRAEWVALVGLVIVAGLEGYIEQRSPS